MDLHAFVLTNDMLVGVWCIMPLSTIFQLYRGVGLLVKETGVLRENHRPLASHCQTLSYNGVWSTPHHERGSNAQRQW